MKRKISNLEEYYDELRESKPWVYSKPFEKLGHAEKINLEVSEGFRKFLIRGAWTKGLFYLAMAAIPTAIAYGIYLRHFA